MNSYITKDASITVAKKEIFKEIVYNNSVKVDHSVQEKPDEKNL